MFSSRPSNGSHDAGIAMAATSRIAPARRSAGLTLPHPFRQKSYTGAELLKILQTPVGCSGNADASLILAHQLIAAKLNIANGSDPAPITSTIAESASVFSEPLRRYFSQRRTLTGRARLPRALPARRERGGHPLRI